MPSGNKMADEPIEPEVQRKPSASNGRGRRRIRARARPNTSTTSPRKLAITRRRGEMLDLREQGYTPQIENRTLHGSLPLLGNAKNPYVTLGGEADFRNTSTSIRSEICTRQAVREVATTPQPSALLMESGAATSAIPGSKKARATKINGPRERSLRGNKARSRPEGLFGGVLSRKENCGTDRQDAKANSGRNVAKSV